MSIISAQSAPRLFTAPPLGRRILAGFSYLQRIGKGAQTRLWFPEKWGGEPVEWAAVRQIELFQEAGNLAIDDLEISEIKRSFMAWHKMRAGGYRVVVLTLGRYEDAQEADDLYILDKKIQDEVTRLIHFLYLAEQSEMASTAQACLLKNDLWTLDNSLPHVATALGGKRLFKPQKQTRAENAFFDILARLPSRHIIHDVAAGLALPDASKEKNWVYLARGEHKPAAFFAALGDTMGIMINQHMRGHGDRMNGRGDRWLAQAARNLPKAA